MPRPVLPALFLLLALAPAAMAQPMRVLEASPRAHAVMDGNRQEFSVRFDAPVDHNTSRLELLRDGAVVRVLQPRLNASPDTLHAIAGSLPAGDYVLRWRAASRRTGEMTEGSLAFTVRG
jgi:methionine-rich copper-binding protein CopC